MTLSERLTKESANKIENWGENLFANACLQKPHLIVESQVPVGHSRIDFRVTNTRSQSSKFVEVTSLHMDGFDRVLKHDSFDRKLRQQADMNANGGGVVLTPGNLKNIQKRMRKEEYSSLT